MKYCFTVFLCLVNTFSAFAEEFSLYVRDSLTGAPVSAVVRINDKPLSVLTGHASISVSGRFTLEVQTPGYRTLRTWFDSSHPMPITIWLDPVKPPSEELLVAQLPEGFTGISGYVRDGFSGSPIHHARIFLFQRPEIQTYTDESGFFLLKFPTPVQIGKLPPTEDLVIEADGYQQHEILELFLQPGLSRLLIDLTPGKGITQYQETHKLLLAERDQIPIPITEEPEKTESYVPVSPYSVYIDPPDSIRVGTSCSCTTCSAVSVMSLETYVKRGLNDEWISSWSTHSLRAGSIAYRSYGTWYVLHPINTNYDICSTTCCQVNDSDTATSTNTAVDRTAGILLQRNNDVFRSEYSAENNAWDDPADGLSCTNSDRSCGDGYVGSPATGWPCLSDSVCLGKGCFGHGRGECQWGTQRWASSPQFRDWVWITNHYYNAHGAGTGNRTAYLTSPLQISSATPSPSTVSPAGTFTINLTTSSAAETAHPWILIGASLLPGGISDPANDTLVTLNPGSNNVSRIFTVPAGTADGLYDLIVALWLDVDENGQINGSVDLALTTYTAASAVTISSTGTCANPVSILSLPYTDNSTTLGRPANLNGYSCPPSSGSEAGPEIVYSITLNQPGNLTVSVTDPLGVDIDVHLLSTCNPASCITRHDTSFTTFVWPGTYYIVADTWTSSTGTQYPGNYTLNVSFTSTAGDTTSPAPVQNLQWSSSMARWEWNAVALDRLGNTETMGNYQIWRSSIASSAGSLLATISVTNYPDPSLPASGECWYYRIRAKDAAGNRDSPELTFIVDNLQATFAGTGWFSSTSIPGYYGTNYAAHSTGGTGSETALWTFTPDETGLYSVALFYPSASNRSPESRFTVSHAGGNVLHPVNQQTNGSTWYVLNSYWLLAGSTYTVTLDDAEPAGYYVIADAVRWSK